MHYSVVASAKTSQYYTQVTGLGLGVQDEPSSLPYVLAGVMYTITIQCRDAWDNPQVGLNPELHFDQGKWGIFFHSA